MRGFAILCGMESRNKKRPVSSDETSREEERFDSATDRFTSGHRRVGRRWCGVEVTGAQRPESAGAAEHPGAHRSSSHQG